jgi:hypothetical protein
VLRIAQPATAGESIVGVVEQLIVFVRGSSARVSNRSKRPERTGRRGMSVKELTEGWQAEKHYSQKVYHYIAGTFSLCGKLGFYTGELTKRRPAKAWTKRLCRLR